MSQPSMRVVVTALIDEFARLGTRCSEVHLQRGVQLLQEDGVPLGFRYLPSKSGPLSLDLQGELHALHSEGFLAMGASSYPHGPEFTTTLRALSLSKRSPATATRCRAEVARAADRVAGTGTAALEALVRPFLLQWGTVEEGELIQVLQRLRPGLHWTEAAAAIRVVGREVGR